MLTQNRFQSYVENEVLSASPVQLVEILYRYALSSITEARTCLKASDIAGRSNAIMKAVEIVSELVASLNFEEGGEIGRNLGRLYEYIQYRLVEANIQQSEEPLIEVETLLTPLHLAWVSLIEDPSSAADPTLSRSVGHAAPVPFAEDSSAPATWTSSY